MKSRIFQLHNLIIALFMVFSGLFGFICVTNSAKAQDIGDSIIDNIDIEYGLQSEISPGAKSDDGHSLGLNQNGLLEVKPSDKKNNLNLRQSPSSNLPETYDLRNVDGNSFVTDIRDQGNHGMCWAFASLGSAESNLIKTYGLNAKKVFSPYHLAYFNYYYNENFGDPLGNRKDIIGNFFRGTYGDGNKIISNNDKDNYLEIGGNEQMATFTLANGKGFAEEKDFPYEKAEPNSTIESTKAYENCDYSLENSIWLSPSETKDIKENIMKYGAAATGIYYSKNNLSDSFAYYYNGNSAPNHSVDIIGWDDNYSKNNFKSENKPSKDGAWLIKNSYGANWGSGGYFWLSYEDLSFKNSLNAVYFFVVKQNTVSDKTYQYDGCSGFSNLTTNSTVKQANMFYADSADQKLDSVSFAVFNPNTKVKIQVYTNLKDKNNPSTGTLANTEPIEANYSNEGYYTLNLENSISIDKNTWFAITMEQTFEDGNELKYSIPVVNTFNNNNVIKFISNAQSGESYYSIDSKNWTDFASVGQFKNMSLILKAHTVDNNMYLISVKSNGPGRIEPSGDVYAKENENITLNFIPEANCYIDKIIVDNNEIQGNQSNYTFEKINSNHNVKVEFKHNPLTILASCGEGGRISPSGEVNVDYKDSKGFNIIAEPNYNINDVIVDGISQGPVSSYTFSDVMENHKISVAFVKEQYTIKATATEGGTIVPSSSAVESGSNITFTITPDGVHEFSSLILDGTQDVTNEIKDNKYTLENVKKQHTLKAEFKLKPSAEIPDGIYKIKSDININYFLDVNAASTQDCGNIQLYQNNDTIAQRFYIHKVGDFYQIKAMCSDKLLDVTGAGTNDYTNLQQYSSNNTKAQLWSIIDQGNQRYTFVSKCSGKCINVSNGQAQNGQNVWLYHSDNSPAERFLIEPDKDKIGFSSSAYMLKSMLSSNNKDKVVDIAGGSSQECANVWLYNANYTAAQKFYFEYKGAGTYAIVSACSRKVLDVAGGANQNMTNIWQYKFNYSNAQLWKIDKDRNGLLSFSPLCAFDKCLDVAGGSNKNETNIHIYDKNQTKAQKFLAIEVEN